MLSGASRDKIKAPLRGAFFIACLLLTGQVWGAPAPECLVDHVDEQVRVKQVFDGDTIQLDDGRKVRLLGINTPEFDWEGGAHEPLAHEARKALSDLLDKSRTIGLRYERQRLDRYKRVLAHLIIDGRTNIQQILLQRGLALAIVVPPNLWLQDCYQLAERQARDKGLGLWGQDYFRSLDVTRQPPQRGGFRLIAGRVDRIKKTARTLWLHLVGDVSLHIAREDWQYFPDNNWRLWQGRDIVARGWLYHRGDKWGLRIRHPQNIEAVRSEE